jgi:hypothetical protein
MKFLRSSGVVRVVNAVSVLCVVGVVKIVKIVQIMNLCVLQRFLFMGSLALSYICCYRQFLSAGAHSVLSSKRSCNISTVVTLLSH